MPTRKVEKTMPVATLVVEEEQEEVKKVVLRESESKTYVTTDYSIFKVGPANRIITNKRINNLLKVIKRKNKLANYPIIVDEDLTIISGQTRYTCAKILNLPLYYKIDPEAVIEDSREESRVTDPWKIQDVLHHWCVLGKPDYIILRDFWERYNFLALSVCADMLTVGGGTSGNRKELFDDGLYKANNVAFGEKVVRMLFDFKVYCPFFAEKTFVATVKSLAKNPQYDHTRMMQKMRYLGGELTKQATTSAYYVQINPIYNHRVSAENRVYLVLPSNRENK